MRKLTIEEMKSVTGGKTYYKTWKCPYCSLRGKESGSSQKIANARAELKLAYHLHNIHNA